MRAGFLVLIVLFVSRISLFASPAPVPGAQAETLPASYERAVSLMNIGKKSMLEERDGAAWGEYVLAYRILSDIKESDPRFKTRRVALKMKSCRRELKRLASSLPRDERLMLSRGRKALARIHRAVGLEERILVIVAEIRDFLEVTKSRGVEAAREGVAGGEGGLDNDGDGLTNAEEVRLGTDPNSADTDGDELSDSAEVETYGTSPLKFDTDEDGLSDGFEVLRFDTDPNDPDTDGEGLLDGEEKIYGTDPNDPDTDGDEGERGGNDKDEVDDGFDPLTHIDDE